MKIVKWKCDRCGREIDGGPIRIEAYSTVQDTGEADVAYRILGGKYSDEGSDLCKSCCDLFFDELAKWISGEMEYGTVEAPKKHYNERNDHARIKIDDDKAEALYMAGWSATKIGEELKCSNMTIVNRLKDRGVWMDPKTRNEYLKALKHSDKKETALEEWG